MRLRCYIFILCKFISKTFNTQTFLSA